MQVNDEVDLQPGVGEIVSDRLERQEDGCYEGRHQQLSTDNAIDLPQKSYT